MWFELWLLARAFIFKVKREHEIDSSAMTLNVSALCVTDPPHVLVRVIVRSPNEALSIVGCTVIMREMLFFFHFFTECCLLGYLLWGHTPTLRPYQHTHTHKETHLRSQ